MSPVLCAHCAMHFMRTNLNPDAPKLCNNCILREELRNPKKEQKMETIEILVKCPKELHASIEEHCMKIGKDFSTYFIDLHQANTQESWRSKTEFTHYSVEDQQEEEVDKAIKKSKTNKKS